MIINKSLIAFTPTSGSGSGSVTSVALTAPTGFSVSGSPITSSGTLALSFASGYALPTTIKQSNWDDAYAFVTGFPVGTTGQLLRFDAFGDLEVFTPDYMPNPLSALGQMIYSNSAGAPVVVAPNTTTTREYLSMLGDGTDGAPPTWETISGFVGGSGTTNYVSKFTGSTTLGNSLIYDDGTNVGINTITAASKLDVNGDIAVRANSSTLKLYGTDHSYVELYPITAAGRKGYFGFGSASTTTLSFVNESTNGHTALLTNGTGNVGINTTSPAAMLHVNGTFISNALWTNTSSVSFWGSYSTAYGTLSWDIGYATIFGTSGNALYLGANGTNNHAILNTSGNFGLGLSPSYKLDVSGQVRISDALAIGTTPDTTLPFKIEKNINSTVGIRFQNTNTGSTSFTAVQFGTDVNGGTAFCNLVYASSGITESGVFKPSGTSLVNTGSGGLNFLSVSQPIRFFTSSANGTLRLELANNGFLNHYNGTNPSASVTDGYSQYSADVVAGNASPHFRTENGAVIKLYQETTSVGNAIFSAGGGNSVLDDSTFDGYTLRQVIKALRNQGILA